MGLKKNQLNRVPFVMVDSTDFASIESGLDAADIDVKLWGLAHGSSTVASAITVSKVPELVHSGLFNLTLEAGDTNAHDAFILRLSSTSTVSCATQVIMLDMDDVTRSDVHSAVTLIASAMSDVESQLDVTNSVVSDAHSAAAQANSRVLVVRSMVSDVESQVDLNASLASDAHSAATLASSRALVIQSRVSDVESALDSQFTYMSAAVSDMHSDLASAVGAVTASVGASDISDIASAVQAIQASRLSDILSAAVQTNSRALVIQSRVSDVESALDSQFTWTSNMLSDMNSDLASQIAGITASVSASDISDIASAVEATQASRLSDILSAAVQGNSRALVIQSRVSDVESALDSQFVWTSNTLSDIQSDLTSQIGDIGTGTVTASDISDIASRVDSVLSSRLSDILSGVALLQTRVTKEVASKSLLSDVNSDLSSQIGGITASVSASDISDIASAVEAMQASRLSDILSAAQEGSSRALVVQSMVSDVDSQLALTDASVSNILSRVPAVVATSSVQSNVYSALSDLLSDFQSRVPKAVATQSLLSDVESNIRSQIAILPTSSVQSDIYSLLSDVSSRTLTAATIATEVLDQAAGVETGVTLREALRVILAACGGKVAGAATTTITIRDTNDAKDRITATVDADGNRSAVTLDLS